MKKFLFILSLCLMSAQSFAAPGDSECTSPVGTVKKGYSLFELHLALNGAYAKMSVPGEAAPRKLKCVMPLRGNNNHCFDCPHTVATCSDTGYSVVITGGGMTGKLFADISSKNRRSLRALGRFRCEKINYGHPEDAHANIDGLETEDTQVEVLQDLE